MHEEQEKEGETELARCLLDTSTILSSGDDDRSAKMRAGGNVLDRLDSIE